MAIAAPRALFAQGAAKFYRIGILNDGDEETRKANWTTFRGRLGELGLVEGKNVSFDVRHARGSNERLVELAAALAASKPDVIVSPGTPATLAAKAATSSIPIVFVAAGDPMRTGLVASLARPSGNITGVSVLTTEISLKSVELLRELVPGLQRIGYLGDLSNKAILATRPELEKFAHKLKLQMIFLDGGDKAVLERSFASLQRERIQGLYVDASGRLLSQRDSIVEFVARTKLPTIYGRQDYMEAGGLLSYETDRQLTFTRGADIVHRVLQGTKPADIPVEQTNKIRMVINMKTARALGIKVPGSLGMRADEVIE
jgi:putative ABC transport system substrate-binding protein